MIKKWDDQNALMYLIKKKNYGIIRMNSECFHHLRIQYSTYYNTEHPIYVGTAGKSGHRIHSTKQRTPSTGVNTSINNSITVFHNVIVIKSKIQLLAWNEKSTKNVFFGLPVK